MKRILSTGFSAILLSASFICAGAVAAAQREPAANDELAMAQRPKPKAGAGKPKSTPAAKAAPSSEDEAELEAIVKAKLAPAEWVARLEAFVKDHPDSSATPRAREFLTSARAALGDEKLRHGDRLAGADLFRAAVEDAPAEMPDKLFVEVVAQLPANLYVLGEQEAAFDLARRIEEKVKDNPQRLLSVAAFYLGIERAGEAARVAEAAVALKPDLAAAHLALGAAYRFSLRLDEAAAAFARARELDPASVAARRSLADLLRATGKAEEALAIYREQLAADPKDGGARAGLTLSLFDAGKREEAERELARALEEQPSNLPLLVGAAYWHAANGDGARAAELADRAVGLEPRFRWVWARVALARALLAQGRPLDAERALRPARAMARFPTLDYELASVLAAAGLYNEAAEELARSFTIRGGQIETRLAGGIPARAKSFTELLAPERRAGLFQFKGADTDDNARVLKGLLALYLATKAESGAADEKALAEAAAEFVAGDDAMRAFRQLYAANRLTQRGAGLRVALDATEAAKRGVDAALASPQASIALFADDLYAMRAQAIASGMTTTAPDAPPELLSKVMRGRIEELAGWALFNQGEAVEAVVRLRRAVSVFPENSIWWKSAQWRLGAALDASGNQKEALASYIKSYRLGAPDPIRRSIIEALYRRLNGSLQGLERLLEGGAATTVAANKPGQPSSTATQGETSTPVISSAVNDATPAPTPTPLTTPAPTSTTTAPTEAPTPTPAPSETPAPTETPSPTPTPAETPAPTPVRPAETTPTPTPEPATAPAEAKRETPAPEPAPTEPKRARKTTTGGACSVTFSESSVSMTVGGSATLALTLENYSGPAPPRLNVSTPNWADIIILAEPSAPAADANTSRFNISSISKNTGAFTVAFATPCGKQQVTVNVR